MPWIYNPQPYAQRVQSFDGGTLFFPSRKRVYVDPSQMSVYVWILIRQRKLANRGGDPKPSPVEEQAVQEIVSADLSLGDLSIGDSAVSDLDTSSSHHQTRVKVTSESSGRRSAKKKSA